MNTRQDNNITDHTDVFYVENNTELSWLNEPGAIYDENKTWKWHDRSYRCKKKKKQY